MSEVRLIARRDGDEFDVTEGVQILYDHTVESMDWGSGFLDNEEALAVIRVALACGFLTPDDAKKKFMDYLSNHQTNLRCQVCGMEVRHGYRGDGESGEYKWFHTDGAVEPGLTPSYWACPREIPADHDVDLWPPGPSLLDAGTG